MKSLSRNWITGVAVSAALLGGLTKAQSQITVKVDSTKPWAGFMNWYSTSDAYVAGGAWGLADLRARFAPALVGATRVVLGVNTNTYNTDGYWDLADGTPNKHLEANFYVDVGTSFGGNDVTFVGTIESNTLPAGWTCSAVIKQFGSGYAYIGDTRVALSPGPFSVTRNIPAGNICQYGFLLYGPNAAPGSPATSQAVSIVVDNEDPSITGQPANQRVIAGDTAKFTVTATGGSTLSYHWKRDNTNIVNGGNISGATTATLTISNAQVADATNYLVTVSDTAGSRDSSPARLRVLTADQFANAVDNPSFEEDVIAFQTVPAPWFNFSGSACLSGSDFPWGTAYDGTNVVQVFNAGQYNGVYQDAPAAPGQVFTGDFELFQSSFDPLSAPTNEAFLEVQFWPVAGAPIAIYNSVHVTNSPAMQDAWMFLPATNGVAAGYASTSTSNAYYLVAPPGTDHVRFQVTLHQEGGGPGSVFVDQMRLMKKLPVNVKSAASGANITLSWVTQGATSYQVVYKDNLNDPLWTPTGSPVAGDGTTKSASLARTGTKRFYKVQTL